MNSFDLAAKAIHLCVKDWSKSCYLIMLYRQVMHNIAFFKKNLLRRKTLEKGMC